MDEHIAPDTRELGRRQDADATRDCCPPHVSELVKNWAGVAALATAALWAVWNFWFKEVLQPRQVPVNISLNLDMQKVPPGAGQPGAAPLMAVELSVKATNPSSRIVYLLPSAWIAHGYRMQAQQARTDFSGVAGRSIRDNEIHPVEKYALQRNAEAVAVGRLFMDDELKPNETIARRIVFHMPPGAFDVVEVFACVPSTSEAEGLGIVWRFEGDQLHWQMMRDDQPIPEHAPGDEPNEDFQQSFSRAAMSL